MAKKKLNPEDATDESNEILTEENPAQVAFSPDDALVLEEGTSASAEETDLTSFSQSVLGKSIPTKEEELVPTIKEADTPPQTPKSDRQSFFELDFHELDRNLTQEEQQEWNSIYASYRGRSALTGTIIGVDPLSINTRDPESGTVKKKTMYCAIVVPYRVRILIPASEMWEQGQERPDYVLQNMVGAVINFVIIKVDRDSGFAIASRKIANRSQRYFFAHRSDLNCLINCGNIS